MTRPLKLGLDLDGLVVDFNAGFMKVLAAGKRDLTPHPYVEPTTWNWPLSLGYRATERDAAWRMVDSTPFWWANLLPYEGAVKFLQLLNMSIQAGELEVYFLTTRGSADAHWQSVEWLHTYGIDRPQVIICKNADAKGLMCKYLGVDAFVDDYVENLKAVRAMNAMVALGVFTRGWNVDEHLPALTHRYDTYDALLSAVQDWMQALSADV